MTKEQLQNKIDDYEKQLAELKALIHSNPEKPRKYFKAKSIQGVHFNLLDTSYYSYKITPTGEIVEKYYYINNSIPSENFATKEQAEFERDRRIAIETIRQFIVEHNQEVTLEYAKDNFYSLMCYDIENKKFTLTRKFKCSIHNLQLAFKHGMSDDDGFFVKKLINNINPEHLALAYCNCRYTDLLEAGCITS